MSSENPSKKLIDRYSQDPLTALGYLAHTGRTDTGPMLGMQGCKIRYEEYRHAFVPRPGCDREVIGRMVSLLGTLHKDSKGALYSQPQSNQHPLAAFEREVQMKLCLSTSQEKAIRVLRKGQNAKVVSRLTLTVDGSKVEKAFIATVHATLKHPCVENWKIMVLDTIGAGPDDIVIYLNKPLSDASVEALVKDLVGRHSEGEFLVDGVPPLGKERLAAGIYGADIPNSTGGMLQFSGSHGDDRVRIVTSALEKSQKEQRDFGECLAEVLDSVGLDPKKPSRFK